MLEAVARRKATVDRLTGTDGRQPREDLVTSAVFGPLAMLASPGRALDALLGLPPQWSLQDAEDVKVCLWPKLGGTQQEPDVTIRARASDGRSRRLLVEVKWGAPLGYQQIGRYVALMRDAGQAPDHVVLLGYEAAKHEQALAEQEAAAELAVTRRSWREAARDLGRLAASGDHACGAWADQVHRFLQATEKGHLFRGFGHLGFAEPASAARFYRAAGASPWFTDAVRPGPAPYAFRRGQE